jgi:hypothetical protein
MQLLQRWILLVIYIYIYRCATTTLAYRLSHADASYDAKYGIRYVLTRKYLAVLVVGHRVEDGTILHVTC